jgi:hypothetical protein
MQIAKARAPSAEGYSHAWGLGADAGIGFSPVRRQAVIFRYLRKQSIAAKALPLRFVRVVYLLLGRTAKVHGCA